MSHTAQDWAWEQQCSGIASHVLVFLAWCHNRHNGLCCPGIERIMEKTRHTERAVRKAIAELIARGLITRIERRTKEGRITSPQYELAMSSVELRDPAPAKKQPLVNPAPAFEQVLNSHPAPANSQSSPCENASPAPANSHPEPGTKEKIKEEKRFENSGLKGKPASGGAEAEEREPTVAEIEARRKEHAATMAALPPELASALSKLGGHMDKIAYAPGWSPRLTPEEQIARLKAKPAVKAYHLTDEQLALTRAGYRTPVVRQAAYA